MSRLLCQIIVDEMPLMVPCVSAAAADELCVMSERGEISFDDYGDWADRHYSEPFQVAGRTATNLEMMAIVCSRQEKRRQRAREQGCCCDEGMTSDGGCRHGLGTCQVFLDAEKLTHKIWRGQP